MSFTPNQSPEKVHVKKAAESSKSLGFKKSGRAYPANLSSNVIEISALQSSNVEAASELTYRPDGLSAFETLINFLKGTIGPGCLSLPLAFKQAGLWAGLGLIFIFGFLNNYCTLQLVQSSQELSKRKNQPLDYGGVAYEACSNSFNSLRKYGNAFKHLINAVIILFQFGVCAVCYVFVSSHIQEIVEQNTDFRVSTTLWNLIIFLPMVIISLIGSLKTIAYLSLVGNVAMFGSLIYITQYLCYQHHIISKLPWITHFDGILMACGSIMYAFEGQSMVLPLENQMKSPKKMAAVISQGMFLVTMAYAACGFLGYITYGSKVHGSIALNLPNTAEMYIIKCLLILVVYTGFTIQQYVIVDLTWPGLKNALNLNTDDSQVMEFLTGSIYRTSLVVSEMALAILAPKLDSIIPLVGATAGILLAFIFPTIINALTFGPKWAAAGQPGRINWKLILHCTRDASLCLLGVFSLFTSLQSTIRSLI